MGLRRSGVYDVLLILTVTANWFARRSSEPRKPVIKLIRQRQQQQSVAENRFPSDEAGDSRGSNLFIVFHLPLDLHQLRLTAKSRSPVAWFSPKKDSPSDWFLQSLSVRALETFMIYANSYLRISPSDFRLLTMCWKTRWFGYTVWRWRWLNCIHSSRVSDEQIVDSHRIRDDSRWHRKRNLIRISLFFWSWIFWK